ncbi:hypothetical protein [Pseudoxanthobacter sp.]|uniref:hypothetical protein n=1 Tax=Pseudoxanthobacter sp. TaxID=1925742 RepID=UPI002FE3DB6E
MPGFLPGKSGLFAEFDASLSINGRFFFGLTCGTSAVILFFVLSAHFFVLSAHVLTHRYSDPPLFRARQPGKHSAQRRQALAAPCRTDRRHGCAVAGAFRPRRL